MAANFVQVNAIDGAADASGTTVAPTSLNVTTGNLLVVGVRWEGGGLNDTATATISDTVGNTYQLVGYSVTGNATENQKVGLYYCLSATGNPANVITATLSVAREFKAIFVAQYSYTGTIALGDTGAGSSSTNVTSQTTSPALDAVVGDLVVGWFANYNSAPPTFTPASPFTVESSSIYARYLEHVVATNGTFTPTVNADGSGDTYAAVSAVFQEAGGGPAAITGSGAVTAPAATVAGTAHTGRFNTNSPALSAGTPTVAGSGTVGVYDPQNYTGTGALSAAVETMSGAGTRGTVDQPGDIALQAPAPTIAGSGTVTNGGGGPAAITGTGALTAPTQTAAGSGTVGHSGTGALTAAVPTVSGTYVPQNITGTGALTAAVPTVSGTYVPQNITGTGVLIANPAAVAGTNIVGSGRSGAGTRQFGLGLGLGI